MKAYYEDALVTLYHGDCREVLPTIHQDYVLITDPPYPNNAGHFTESVAAAREVLVGFAGNHALVFWSELERPPLPLPLVAVHVWHRTNVNGRPYEPIYHYDVSGTKRRSEVIPHPAIFGGAGPGCHEYLGHPTQKPVDLMRHLLLKVPRIAVCDPFAGVGATLRAAKDLGRTAIGIETEEHFCEIAARRCSQEVFDFTGAA